MPTVVGGTREPSVSGCLSVYFGGSSHLLIYTVTVVITLVISGLDWIRVITYLVSAG